MRWQGWPTRYNTLKSPLLHFPGSKQTVAPSVEQAPVCLPLVGIVGDETIATGLPYLERKIKTKRMLLTRVSSIMLSKVQQRSMMWNLLVRIRDDSWAWALGQGFSEDIVMVTLDVEEQPNLCSRKYKKNQKKVPGGRMDRRWVEGKKRRGLENKNGFCSILGITSLRTPFRQLISAAKLKVSLIALCMSSTFGVDPGRIPLFARAL